MKYSNILKNWKIWIVIIAVVLLIILSTIFIIRNKMTPEETVSKFMYLIEKKEYEEAKKLSSKNLEKLDIISNLKPTNLIFEFSKEKKEATSILLEEDIEVTNMNIKLKNTILGWKIEDYEVVTELIKPQIIEDRLKRGKKVSDIQLLYWGESDLANKEEIAEYITDNYMVAMIFAETMKAKNYDKANELYQPITDKNLTIEQLKEYNWNNYKIINNFEMMKGTKGDLNCITIELDNKKIWIYVAGKQITFILEATN